MHEMYQSYMYKDMNNLDLPVYRQRLQNQIGFHALCFLKLVHHWHQSWKTMCRPTWWCTCMPIELLCSCADQNIGERIKLKGEVSMSNYCMPCHYDLNLNKESNHASHISLLDKFISHLWGLVCTQNYVDFPAWYLMVCHRHRAWNCGIHPTLE